MLDNQLLMSKLPSINCYYYCAYWGMRKSMTIKKIIAFTLIGLVVMLLLVVLVAVRGMDGVVKNVIEAKGSMFTGTAVTLDSMRISLLDQRVKMHKLTIANPEGFNNPYVFSMNEMVLSVEVDSLLGSAIMFNEVLFDGVEIVVEQKNMTSNLQVLMKSIEKERDDRDDRDGIVSVYSLDEEGETIRMGDNTARLLMIKDLRFTNIKLTLIREGQDDYTVKVHDIMMTNVGPLGSEDLSVEIIRQLVSQSKQVVKDVAKGKLVDGLSTKLSDKNKEALNRAKSLLK